MANQNLNITIRALDKTKGAFGSVTKGIGSVTKAIFSMRTALVAVAGAAGIGILVRQSLQATDTLAKTASKIGTTTEALSKLRFAADITGVSTQTMDMALQRFTRRTAEAAKGTGEAKSALRTLGLDARKLVEMPLDERMLALSDAFAQQTNESTKLALAFKLFDSEGAALVNTLALGREELSALFDEAEDLGAVMSGQAANGVERANDALTKLFTMLRGLRDQIVAAFAPAIENLANIIKNKLIDRITAANGSFQEFARSLVEDMIGGLVSFIRTLATIVQKIEEFADKVTLFFKRIQYWLDTGELSGEITFDTNIGVVSGGLLNAANALNQFKLNLGETTGSLDVNTGALGNNRSILDDWHEAFTQAGDTIPSVQQGMLDVANTLKDGLTNGFTDAIKGAKSFSDAMADMARSVIDSLTKMLVQYYITQPLFNAITGFTNPSMATPAGGVGPMPQRAIGGSVQAGQPYMVGERGMEMFVPNQSGSIVSNRNLGGDGVVVNQTINIQTGVSQTVRAEINSLMPKIQESTKNAVIQERAKGGAYSKQLLGY